MAAPQNIQETASQFESDKALNQQKWKSAPHPKATAEIETPCFECNICLDSAHEPVITLCGHLYCWPCIYKWIHVQSTSPDSEQQPQCPVCKANISDSSLVPLYGRGTTTSDSESKKPQLGIVIPRRPASGLHTLINSPTSSNSRGDQQYYLNPLQSESQAFNNSQQYFPNPYGSFAYVPSTNLEVLPTLMSPTSRMFGELLYARLFGNEETGLYTYPNPNIVSTGNTRIRRQEIQLHKSLNRVSIFFLICLILCLIVF